MLCFFVVAAVPESSVFRRVRSTLPLSKLSVFQLPVPSQVPLPTQTAAFMLSLDALSHILAFTSHPSHVLLSLPLPRGRIPFDERLVMMIPRAGAELGCQLAKAKYARKTKSLCWRSCLPCTSGYSDFNERMVRIKDKLKTHIRIGQYSDGRHVPNTCRRACGSCAPSCVPVSSGPHPLPHDLCSTLPGHRPKTSSKLSPAGWAA